MNISSSYLKLLHRPTVVNKKIVDKNEMNLKTAIHRYPLYICPLEMLS